MAQTGGHIYKIPYLAKSNRLLWNKVIKYLKGQGSLSNRTVRSVLLN